MPSPDSAMPAPTITNYRDLLVWQKAMSLCESVYRVCRRLPPAERDALGNQLRRAAVSVASNIAEGHSRSHTGEYIQFLAIARASLSELETQLTIIVRVEYLTVLDVGPAMDSCGELGRMLHGLSRSLRKRLELKQGEKRTRRPPA